MSFLNLKELKGMRIPAIIMGVLIIGFTVSGIYGYRLWDVFGSGEWEREGPPGTSNHSGSHHYYHK